MISRRGLITGLISLAAAPAIVRASSLMPVKAEKLIDPREEMIKLLKKRVAEAEGAMLRNIKTYLYGDRVYAISGNSANVYFSEPFSVLFK